MHDHSNYAVQVTVAVPPLNSEGTFDFRVRLSGSSSVSGPGGEHISGLVRLFSEPMNGSLTGTSILSGAPPLPLTAYDPLYSYS